MCSSMEIGRENALKWPLSLNIVSVSYHGEIFEGNACRKLLKSSDTLLNQDIMGMNFEPLRAIKYVSAFKAMNRIVEACFGTSIVVDDIQPLVTDLIKKYLAIEHLSITLKMHIIFEHLVSCLQNLNNRGLGLFSEQAGESIHKEFLKTFGINTRSRT